MLLLKEQYLRSHLVKDRHLVRVAVLVQALATKKLKRWSGKVQ